MTTTTIEVDDSAGDCTRTPRPSLGGACEAFRSGPSVGLVVREGDLAGANRTGRSMHEGTFQGVPPTGGRWAATRGAFSGSRADGSPTTGSTGATTRRREIDVALRQTFAPPCRHEDDDDD